jgi:hypothetical protein
MMPAAEIIGLCVSGLVLVFAGLHLWLEAHEDMMVEQNESLNIFI